RANGESEGRASLSVHRIHLRPTRDEKLYCVVLRAPRSNVQGRAVRSDVPITVSFGKPGVDVNPEIEELADAVGISISCKFCQELSTSCLELGQARIPGYNGSNTCRVVSRARRDE